MNLDRIIAALSSKRFPLEDEKQTQAAMADAFSAAGLNAEREVPVTGGVIDFVVTLGETYPPGTRGYRYRHVGVEAKIKGTKRDIVRQMIRYAADANLDALVLVTVKPVHMGTTIAGKPVRVIELARAWL